MEQEINPQSSREAERVYSKAHHQLYKLLNDNGIQGVGSMDDLYNAMQKPEHRDWAFQTLSDMGVNMGDRSAFDKAMSQPFKVNANPKVQAMMPYNNRTTPQVAPYQPKPYNPQTPVEETPQSNRRLTTGYVMPDNVAPADSGRIKTGYVIPEEKPQEEPRKEYRDYDELFNDYREKYKQTDMGRIADYELNRDLSALQTDLENKFRQSPEFKSIVDKYQKMPAKNQQEADELTQMMNEELVAKMDEMYGEQYQNDANALYDTFTQKLYRDNPEINEDLMAIQKRDFKDSLPSQIETLRAKVGNVSNFASRKGAFSGMSVGLNPMLASILGRMSDDDKRNNQASARLLDQTEALMKDINNPSSNVFKSFARSIKDNTSADKYTFGLSEIVDKKALNDALAKSEKGEKLTESEENLLEASLINMTANAYFQDQISKGHMMGQVTAESLPFMLEMVANPISGTGNAMAKSLLKFGMKKFGISLAGKGAKRVAGKAIKFGVSTLTNALSGAGMTLTSSLPRVGADTYRRLNENYEITKDGNLIGAEIGTKDNGELRDTSLGEAFAKGLASTFFENYSEMMFNSLKGFRFPAKMRNMVKPVLESDMGKLFKGFYDNAFKSDISQATQWHGIAEEFLEEVGNNLASATIGDMEYDELLDIDKNLDTFLGLLPTSIMFGVAGGVGLAKQNRQFNKALENIWNSGDENLRSAVRSLMSESRDFKGKIKAIMTMDMTNRQKKELIDLVVNDEKARITEEGMAGLSDEQRAEDMAQADAQEAEENAQEITPDNYVSAMKELNRARRGTDTARIQQAEARVSEFENEFTSMADNARTEAEQFVSENQNPEMGGLVEANIGDETMQITGGNLVMNEDGSVNSAESSEVIYYKDKDGKTHESPASAFSKVQMTPADAFVTNAYETALAEARNQFARGYQDIPTPKVGDVIMDDGVPSQVTQVTPDGVQLMQTDAQGNPVNAPFMTFDEYYSRMEQDVWGETPETSEGATMQMSEETPVEEAPVNEQVATPQAQVPETAPANVEATEAQNIEFPKDENGVIDLEAINDADTMRQAIAQFAGETGVSEQDILASLMEDAEADLKKAQKLRGASKIMGVKKANERINMLKEAMTPKQSAPATTPVSENQNMASRPSQVETTAEQTPVEETKQAEVPVASQETAQEEIAPEVVTPSAEKENVPESDIQAEIAEARQEVDTNPSEAQKEAGNYRMGHVTIDGLDISIENPKGSVRRGTDRNGKSWETPINNDYGYIKKTEGADGDHVDVFLSDNPSEGKVYVVNQNVDGKFDEHKVMYGFNSEQEARDAYLSNYEKGWNGIGSIVEMTKDEFKDWLKNGDTTKPVGKQKPADRPNTPRKMHEAEMAMRQNIEKLAKYLGFKVEWSSELIDGIANGKTEGDTIILYKHASRPLNILAGHEITHRIKEVSSEKYALLEALAKNEFGETFKMYRQAYADAVKAKSLEDRYTDADLDEEGVCDTIGAIIGDSNLIDRLAKKADRTILEKISDFLDKMLNVFGNDFENGTYASSQKVILDAMESIKGAKSKDIEIGTRNAHEEAVNILKTEGKDGLLKHYRSAILKKVPAYDALTYDIDPDDAKQIWDAYIAELKRMYNEAKASEGGKATDRKSEKKEVKKRAKTTKSDVSNFPTDYHENGKSTTKSAEANLKKFLLTTQDIDKAFEYYSDNVSDGAPTKDAWSELAEKKGFMADGNLDKDAFSEYAKNLLESTKEDINNIGKPRTSPWKFVEQSKTLSRPPMKGVHYEDGFESATNGFALWHVKKDYPAENEGRTFGKDGHEIGGTFPNVKMAIPAPEKMDSAEVDLKKMLKAVNAIMIGYHGEPVIFKFGDKQVITRSDRMKTFLEALIANGAENRLMFGNNRPVVGTFGESTIMIMPHRDTMNGGYLINTDKWTATYENMAGFRSDNVFIGDDSKPKRRAKNSLPFMKDDSVSSIGDAFAQTDGAVDLGKFSIATEQGLEDAILSFAGSSEAKRLGWAKDNIKEIVSETRDLLNIIHDAISGDVNYDEFAKKNPTIRVDWRDGIEKPIVTWSRNNIEYKYDMSADTFCINNDALENILASPAMVDLMLHMSKFDKYDTSDYIRLYQTLRDLGFVVPCKGCFDASTRLKMLPSVAQKFVKLVNETIDERNKNPEAFDNALRDEKSKSVTGLSLSASNKEDAVKIGVAGDQLTEHISWTQLMSADGQTKALADWGGIFRAWQRTGAGRPKDKLLPEPYAGQIVSQTTTIIAPFGEKTPSYKDLQVNMGTGLRRNSHSEYRPTLVVDEMQFMRDAWLKNLCVFKYMKELDDVRLFGKMGVKFNMSAFPTWIEGGKACGLDADGNYAWAEESVGGREFASVDKEGNTHFDGYKGLEEAKKYINKDVSLSVVAMSVPHLIKTLTDVPTPSDKSGMFGSVIGFHNTGATSEQLEKQGLGKCRATNDSHPFSEEAMTDYDKGVTNFEQVQNDRFGKGWRILSGKKAGTDVAEGKKIEFSNGTAYRNDELGLTLYASKNSYKSNGGAEEFNVSGAFLLRDSDAKTPVPFDISYNDKVRELGGNYAYKEASDFYIKLLRDNGFIPRFDFVVPKDVFIQMCKDANVDPNHPKLGWNGGDWSPCDAESYYSLFCDYGMTDPETGFYSPHLPVLNGQKNADAFEKALPENYVEIIKDGIARYSERRASEIAKEDEAIVEYCKRSIEDGKMSPKEVKKILEKHGISGFTPNPTKPKKKATKKSNEKYSLLSHINDKFAGISATDLFDDLIDNDNNIDYEKLNELIARVRAGYIQVKGLPRVEGTGKTATTPQIASRLISDAVDRKSEGDIPEEEIEEKILKWAMDNDSYVPLTSLYEENDVISGAEAPTAESIVFLSHDGTILKATESELYSSFGQLINALANFSEQNPKYGYEVVGITEGSRGHKCAVVTMQRLAEGNTLKELYGKDEERIADEVDKCREQYGFAPTDEYDTFDCGGSLFMADVTGSNVVVEPDGKYGIIDARMDDLNGYDWGVEEKHSLTDDTTYDDIKFKSDEMPAEEYQTKYSIVTDPEVLDWFDKAEKIETYKTMVLLPDGSLASPMADTLNETGNKRETLAQSDRLRLGDLHMSDEHPELANAFTMGKDGVEYGHITINKPEGGSTKVAYNPYDHTSNWMLNDQFEGAWQRDNLVIVKFEIATDEWKDNPYKAQYAKDAVGRIPWKKGRVAEKVGGDNERFTYLTRYSRPVEIVPMDKYAEEVKKMIGDIPVPYNVVTSEQRDALFNAGVEISEPTNSNSGNASRSAYNEWNKTKYSLNLYSNTRNAVELVKQEKATPQQWLAMIQKNGLKKEEDRWIGLTDWLNTLNKSVTKDEVLDYIDNHTFTLEEVKYSESAGWTDEQLDDIYNNGLPSELQKLDDQITDEFASLLDSGMEYETAWDELASKYGSAFEEAYDLGEQDTNSDVLQWIYVGSLAELAGLSNDSGNKWSDENPINPTRQDYTSRGLENRREIALTIPSIEPYNENDEIHFGDAGNGRAIAWLRFGDASTSAGRRGQEIESRRINDELEKKYHMSAFRAESEGLMSEEDKKLYERANALYRGEIEPEEGKKVLFIDEIQSKRHQDGREKGYATPLTTSEYGKIVRSIAEKYGLRPAFIEKDIDVLSPEDYQLYEDVKASLHSVPDAPFRTNWHELAMKRAIALAVEEGYDKVAWTTGMQQAERYGIGSSVMSIDVSNITEEDRQVWVTDKDGNPLYVDVNNDGIITSGYGLVPNGSKASDVFGKDLAGRIMSATEDTTFPSDELDHIGGEGMKSFYDKMLPSFVSKYVKKWGAKVEDIELPDLENGITAHSFDVTPAMVESVSRTGQPRYSLPLTAESVGKKVGVKVSASVTSPFGDGTKAWSSDGKVFINPAYVNNDNDATRLVLNESVATKGLEGLLGKSFEKAVQSLYKHLPNDAILSLFGNGKSFTDGVLDYLADVAEGDVRPDYWNDVKKALDDAFKAEGIEVSLSDNDARYLIWRSQLKGTEVEKTIRDTAMRLRLGIDSTDPTDPDDGGNSPRGWIDRLSEAIRTEGRQVGLTDTQIKDMTKYAIAWHGSGADFDRFDSSFMGTGEGAQAHGYGHYVAVSRDTAKSYATRMRSTFVDPVYKGEAMTADRINSMRNGSSAEERAISIVLSAIRMGYNPQRAYEMSLLNAEDAFNDATRPIDIEHNKAVLDAMRGLDPSDFSEGENPVYVYEVDIPDNNGENYLEEQELIGEELRDKVVGALKGMDLGLNDTERREDMIYLDNKDHHVVIRSKQSGGDLYEELEDLFGRKDQKMASEFLLSLGYAGIHYDGRRDGECYVIFNDEDVKILDKQKYSLVGESGISNLDHKYAGLILSKLDIAKSMDEAGKSADEIHYTTNWSKGADGKWRFEIPDLEIDSEAFDNLKTDEPALLSEFVGESGMYKTLSTMYPELANLKVKKVGRIDTAGAEGLLDMDNGEIVLRDGMDLIKTEEVLAHEIQHFIQTQEGFALGGVPDGSITKEVMDAETKYNDAVIKFRDRKMSYLKFNDIKKNYDRLRIDAYRRLAGEVEARSVMDRYYMDNSERRSTAPVNTEDVARDQQIVKYSLVTPAQDAEYMEAVNSGDMEKAQNMVNELARKSGYSADDEYRMSHRAPNHEWDVNLLNTEDLVPRDYWQHPEWYTSSDTERKAHAVLARAIAKAEKSGDASIYVYRAVPKDVKEDNLRNGDWVTPLREYADEHGKAHINGQYRVISQLTNIKNLYWDANSTAELGYDNGSDYVYANTKNNRKLADAVTYDDNGDIIPLSKRFNKRNSDERYSIDLGSDFDEKTQSWKPDALSIYEKAVLNNAFYRREALQDSMLGLKEAQEAIAQASGTPIRDHENAYMAENSMSSKNLVEMNRFMKTEFKAITDAMKQAGIDISSPEKAREFNDYLITKHGIERNRDMSFRKHISDYVIIDGVWTRKSTINGNILAMWNNGRRAGLTDAQIQAQVDAYKQYLEDHSHAPSKEEIADRIKDFRKEMDDIRKQNLPWRQAQEEMDKVAERFGALLGEDFSGLTEVLDVATENPDGTPRDKDAIRSEIVKKSYDSVETAEGQYDVDDIWSAINNATDHILKSMNDGGLTSNKTDGNIKGMYEYYVPLKGWDEETAMDKYQYLNESFGTGSVLVKAGGRTSRADDPLATIGNNGCLAIARKNRNLMKQKFLFMVLNHPTNLAKVGRMYVRRNANDIFEVQTPDIHDGDSPMEIKNKVDQFEAQMQNLVKNDPDNYKMVGQGDKLPLKIDRSSLKEHQAVIYQNGIPYVVTIMGSPRATQAINGATNPDVNGRFFEFMSSGTRLLASLNTALNPDFVLSNLSRDCGYTHTMLMAKEGAMYAKAYSRNWRGLSFRMKGGKMDVGAMVGLISRYENDTLDMSNDEDRYFKEFMDNGGETGYTFVQSVDDYKKLIQEAMNEDGKNAFSKSMDAVKGGLEAFSRWAEDIARFACYKTSREMGRSVEKSIWDAKEVSVNFNKKGAGARFIKDYTGLNYLTAGFSQYGRVFLMFMNAGVQGLNNAFNVAKDNPNAFAGVMSVWGLSGIIMPLLNMVIRSMGGGDPDDYWNIPEYTRQSNVMIAIPNSDKYLAIPVAIELRVFYGLGELFIDNIVNHKEKNPKDTMWRMLELASGLLPVDIVGENNPALAFVPSVVKPAVEVASNQSWSGTPIHRESSYNKFAPKYTLAYSSTDDWLVKTSKSINKFFGGSENLNTGIPLVDWANDPSSVQYLTDQYFGGVGQSVRRLMKPLFAPFTDDELKSRDVIILNRFIKQAGAEQKDKRINNLWFAKKDEMDRLSQRAKDYKDRITEAESEAERKIATEQYSELVHSDEYKDLQVWKSMQSRLNKVHGMDINPKEKAEFEYSLKMMMYGLVTGKEDMTNEGRARANEILSKRMTEEDEQD